MEPSAYGKVLVHFHWNSHLVCAQIFAQLAQVFGEFALFLRVQNNAEYF